MHTIGLVAVASLAVSGPVAGGDPFVGKWRLDVSRSVIVDQMRVDALGRNRYAFRFEGGPVETIVADGTDQPGLPGTTLSVKAEGARALKVVRKQAGHIIVSATWRLSEDGRTLRDAFTSVQPDGSTLAVDYVYRRMAGASGFAGDWESTTQPTGMKYELEIQPYGSKGLSFIAQGAAKNIVFDGRDHAVQGATEARMFSGRRQGGRALDYTEKTNGKVQYARAFQLSRDGRTLKMTLRTAGIRTPNVFVFERE